MLYQLVARLVAVTPLISSKLPLVLLLIDIGAIEFDIAIACDIGCGNVSADCCAD